MTAEQPSPSTPVAQAVAIEPADASKGRELVAKFECNRCHDETGLEPAPRATHCFSCHDDISKGKFPAPAAALTRWRKTTDPYTVAPSLLHVAQRLRREWVVGFLLQPVDVRPELHASMPRLRMTEQEARDLAAYLTEGAPLPGPVPAGDAKVGERLVRDKACGQCHAFTGAQGFQKLLRLDDEQQRRAVRLAPDLKFTRERFVASQLAAWLTNPKAVKADTLMPNHGLTQKEASSVATYLVSTALEQPTPRDPPQRLPVLQRRVGYEEVERDVLSVTCRHCHSDPDASLGDGGPGNTGGFGFAPRKLDLASYRGVNAGYVGQDGQRHSVFAPMADGTPRLVAALLARQREELGIYDPQLRGMPLGFPALTPEQIQLVDSWVAQGRPR